MSVTLEQLQPFIDKEAVIHLNQPDGTTEEITGTIKAATVAGVPIKKKGKSGVDLHMVADIYEIDYAPIKDKTISQKALAPIEYGNARQHLADRHGIQLSWVKENDEKAAFDWHASLDHDDLGHRHFTPAEVEERKRKASEKDSQSEREAALSDDA